MRRQATHQPPFVQKQMWRGVWGLGPLAQAAQNCNMSNGQDPVGTLAQPTRICSMSPAHDLLEDGLYTGETALHIAIVNGELTMLRMLLDKGASILSRATGTFFQPITIRNRVLEPSRESWLIRCKAWLEGRDLGSNPFAYVSQQTNESSGCYYGESPLSFAASVGNVEACKMLLDEWEARRLYMVKKADLEGNHESSSEAAIGDKIQGESQRKDEGPLQDALQNEYISLKPRGLPHREHVTGDWFDDMDKTWDPDWSVPFPKNGPSWWLCHMGYMGSFAVRDA